MEYLSKEGLNALIAKIKSALSEKVDAVTGKGLSTNDLTDTLKSNYDAAVTKVNGIDSGAQINVIETVKVNGTAQTVSDKTVNITVPTDNSSLANGAGYQTAANVKSIVAGYGYQTSEDVDSAISTAVGKITSFELTTVTAFSNLPTTGVKGTVYLVPDTHSDSNDIYDEYIWVTNKYEKIGNTDVNLSSYAKTSDFSALGATEVNSAWDE